MTLLHIWSPHIFICGHLHLNMLVWSTSHHSWTHVISLHVDSTPPHIPTCAWLHTSTYLHLWSQHILQLVSISLHIPRCGWTPPSHISTCECHTSVFGLHISTYLHMLTLTSPHNSTFCLQKFKYKCSKLLHSCIKVKHNHTVPVIWFIDLLVVVIMTAPWAWVVDVMFHWLDFSYLPPLIDSMGQTLRVKILENITPELYAETNYISLHRLDVLILLAKKSCFVWT